MMLANTLAPWLPFSPGFSAFSFDLAIPMTLLAAVIERPFLTAAGITRFTLARSIQANLVSTLLGVLTVLPAVALVYVVGPTVWAIGVILSVVVERGFLKQSGPADERSPRLGWIVIGNVVSSLTLWIIPFVVFAIQDADPTVRTALKPYEFWLRLMTVGASGIAIIWACALPFVARSSARARATRNMPAPASTGQVTSPTSSP